MSLNEQPEKPIRIIADSNDRPAFVIAYMLVAASGAVVGFLAGWLLR